MNIRASVLIALFIGLGMLTVSSGVAQDFGSDDEIEGVVIPAPADSQATILAAIEESPFAEVFDIPDKMFYLEDKADRYVVLVDQEYGAGEAVVEVDEMIDIGEWTVLIAANVDHSTTGDRVATRDFLEDASQFAGELIRVDIEHYHAFAANADVQSGLVTTQAMGAFVRSDAVSLTPVTETGVDALAAMTSDEMPGESGVEFVQSFGDIPDDRRTMATIIDFNEDVFWSEDVDVTLDIAVSAETGIPYVAAADIHSDRVASPAAVTTADNGDIVTVEADVAEARVSIRETLQGIPPCPEDFVTVPKLCVPAVTDVPIHVGLLFDGVDSVDGAVAYVGLSNVVQSTSVEIVAGEAEVTGRVVDGGEIAPSLAGEQALIAYDIEYRERSGYGPPTEIVAFRDELVGVIEEQLINTAKDQDQNISDNDGDSTGETGGAGTGDVGFEVDEQGFSTFPDGEVKVAITVQNPIDEPLEDTIHLMLDEQVHKTKTLELNGSERRDVEFILNQEEAGEYTVGVAERPEWQQTIEIGGGATPEDIIIVDTPPSIFQINHSVDWDLISLNYTAANTADREVNRLFELYDAETGEFITNYGAEAGPNEEFTIEFFTSFEDGDEHVLKVVDARTGEVLSEGHSIEIVHVDDADTDDGEKGVDSGESESKDDASGAGFGIVESAATIVLILLWATIPRLISTIRRNLRNSRSTGG